MCWAIKFLLFNVLTTSFLFLSYLYWIRAFFYGIGIGCLLIAKQLFYCCRSICHFSLKSIFMVDCYCLVHKVNSFQWKHKKIKQFSSFLLVTTFLMQFYPHFFSFGLVALTVHFWWQFSFSHFHPFHVFSFIVHIRWTNAFLIFIVQYYSFMCWTFLSHCI